MGAKVIIGDDLPLIRMGLRSVVQHARSGMRVVLEASNGRDVVRCVKRFHGALYILDIYMPQMNGLETARCVLAKDPTARVILLGNGDNNRSVEHAFASGAHGYLGQRSSGEEVLAAIRTVQAGDHYLSPEVAKDIAKGLLCAKGANAPMGSTRLLTAREREVLRLIAEGFSSKQIATKLRLSIHTVQAHRSKLMAKLKLHKHADVIRYALREGMASL